MHIFDTHKEESKNQISTKFDKHTHSGISMYAHTRTRTYTPIFSLHETLFTTHTHAHTKQKHIPVCMYNVLHAHACTHTGMHAHAFTHTNTHTHIYIYTHSHTHSRHAHILMHAHIHTPILNTHKLTGNNLLVPFGYKYFNMTTRPAAYKYEITRYQKKATRLFRLLNVLRVHNS